MPKNATNTGMPIESDIPTRNACRGTSKWLPVDMTIAPHANSTAVETAASTSNQSTIKAHTRKTLSGIFI
jgi:hypothetical protein